MRVGRIREVWRYPVKSMAGESLRSAEVDPGGIPGDRAWAVRDEVRGGIRGAKKIGALMRCAARYESEPARGRVPAPEITLPDGARLHAGDPDAAARLSRALDHEVTLWPLLPPDALDHYRRGAPDHAEPIQELRAIFGRTPDEPLPEFQKFPRELFEYESPLGTYFDAYPLHLVTTATLERLAKDAPASRVDVRRFRPNFVVETLPGFEGYVDAGWEGKRLRVGGLDVETTISCPRCVMVTHGFAELPKDPALLRAIVKEANQSVGLYARPASAARVSVGDPVELLN
jgi:uncharacterized protein YcbX